MIRCALVLALSIGCHTPPPDDGSHDNGGSGASSAVLDDAVSDQAASSDSVSNDSASRDANSANANASARNSGEGSNGRPGASGDSPSNNGTASTDPSASPAGAPQPSDPPMPAQTIVLAPARAGRISTDAVRRVIDAKRGEVGACYEEGLNRNRDLEGQVSVRFLVGPDGHVEDAEVYQSTLGDTRVERCITTAMRSWEFPRPRPRGRSVLLTYPYVLSTE